MIFCKKTVFNNAKCTRQCGLGCTAMTNYQISVAQHNKSLLPSPATCSVHVGWGLGGGDGSAPWNLSVIQADIGFILTRASVVTTAVENEHGALLTRALEASASKWHMSHLLVCYRPKQITGPCLTSKAAGECKSSKCLESRELEVFDE